MAPPSPEGAARVEEVADADPAAAGLEAVYLGNEGFLLRAHGRAVLIDALFGDGLEGYPVVAAETRRRMEGARGEFADVELVLATHEHADHFDPEAVARHLAANGEALFVSTPQAVARLPASVAQRARAVWQPPGEVVSLAHGGISLTAFQLTHGSGTEAQNLGFVVDLGDGGRVLHVGDTELGPGAIVAAGGAEVGVDLGLLPFWIVGDGSGVRRHLAARRVGLMHLPAADAPPSYFGSPGSLAGLVERLRSALPGAVVLDRPGRSLVQSDEDSE